MAAVRPQCLLGELSVQTWVCSRGQRPLLGREGAPQRDGLTEAAPVERAGGQRLPTEFLEKCSFLKRKLTFIFSIHKARCGLTSLVMKTTQVRTLMTGTHHFSSLKMAANWIL